MRAQDDDAEMEGSERKEDTKASPPIGPRSSWVLKSQRIISDGRGRPQPICFKYVSATNSWMRMSIEMSKRGKSRTLIKSPRPREGTVAGSG